MVRHLTRKHDEPHYSRSGTITADQHQKFKAQKSVQLSSSPVYEWPLSHMPDMLTNEQKEPGWLVALRRIAEFKRLLKDLSLTSSSQAFIEPYKLSIDRPMISEPMFKIENLEILGYTAHICKECLISHPLTLYWERTNMVTVPTVHKCDNERLFKVQQDPLDKEDVIETLKNGLPNLMFHAVKKWTGNVPLLKTVEIPPAFESLQNFIPADNRRWAFRAIRNGSTTLSDDELVDFLDLTGLKTYAGFMMGRPTKKYQMYIATTAAA